MKDLLHFLIKNITGSDEFKIAETVIDDKIILTIDADPAITGLIIGKGGTTIRSLRKIVSIRAAIEDKLVNINLAETS